MPQTSLIEFAALEWIDLCGQDNITGMSVAPEARMVLVNFSPFGRDAHWFAQDGKFPSGCSRCPEKVAAAGAILFKRKTGLHLLPDWGHWGMMPSGDQRLAIGFMNKHAGKLQAKFYSANDPSPNLGACAFLRDE